MSLSDVTEPPSFAEQCRQRDCEAMMLFHNKSLTPVEFAIEAIRLNLWARQYKNEVVLLEAMKRLEAP